MAAQFPGGKDCAGADCCQVMVGSALAESLDWERVQVERVSGDDGCAEPKGGGGDGAAAASWRPFRARAAPMPARLRRAAGATHTACPTVESANANASRFPFRPDQCLLATACFASCNRSQPYCDHGSCSEVTSR